MEQQNIPSNQTISSNMPHAPNNNRNLIIIGVILLLLVGAGSYFLGAKSQQTKQTAMVEVTPTIEVTKEPTTTSIPTQSPNNSPIPTKHLVVNPMASWRNYTNSQYGFSFQYPSDWTIAEGQNGVSVADSQKNTLAIGVKKQGDSTRITRTGVGAGDVIEKGSITFLNMSIPRNVLVFQGNDMSVLYKNAGEINTSNLVFTLSVDNMAGSRLNQLSEDTADKIVESFKLSL